MTELREFARRSSDFQQLGVRIIGISVDDQQRTHETWEKAAAKKITLLSDPGAKVVRQYGLLHEKGHGESDIALRTTVLIDPEGHERWRRVSKSVPDIPTADETLAEIRKAQQEPPGSHQQGKANLREQREAMARLGGAAGTCAVSERRS